MERFARILPDRADDLTATDLAAAVPGPAPDDRPFVLANMIATAVVRLTRAIMFVATSVTDRPGH